MALKSLFLSKVYKNQVPKLNTSMVLSKSILCKELELILSVCVCVGGLGWW